VSSVLIRYEDEPGTAWAPADVEYEGGSLAGNESSDASSTRADSAATAPTRLLRDVGISTAARPAPAPMASSAHIARFDTHIDSFPSLHAA